jgi:thiamine-phosphate pyrophosphorylase
MFKDFNFSIYLVTDDAFFVDRDVVRTIEQAIEGGVTAVQYRFKNKPSRKMYEELLVLRDITKQNKVALIVNDRVDLAIAVKADGVHVGQEDLPPDVCRKIIPEDMIVGYSVNNLEQLKDAMTMPIDYIGFGSVFHTQTKKDYKYAGLEALCKATNITSIPIIAIGGITHYNLKDVLKCKVKGVAVVSAILGFEDVKRAASDFKQMYKESLSMQI